MLESVDLMMQKIIKYIKELNKCLDCEEIGLN